MQKWLKSFRNLLLIVLLTTPLLTISQFGTGDPGDDVCDVCDTPTCPCSSPSCIGSPQCPPEPVPFDGGATLLVAAGVGYGLKKARDYKKKAKKNEVE